jgi:hypothetical protein
MKLSPVESFAKYEWMKSTRILKIKEIYSFFFQKIFSFAVVIKITSLWCYYSIFAVKSQRRKEKASDCEANEAFIDRRQWISRYMAFVI